MLRNTLLTLILAAALIGCDTRLETKQYADYSKSSGFNVTNADNVSVENLEVLAKVWGFAKYHHPAFSREGINADYELFELLPKVAYAEKDERNAVLAEWVEGLGEFKSAEDDLRKEIADKGYTSPTDWEWLGDEESLGTELSGLLQDLRWAKRKKPSRYARYVEYLGQADFSVESGMRTFPSDTGYNLLILFRLWNMAEYYFPSVNITDKKWSEVLSEYTPKFLSTERVKWTTAELIAELSDTHSMMFTNPVYSSRKLPVELGFVEGKLIVTDSRMFLMEGEEPVFEPGDEIVSIGGQVPEYFVERARKYIAASNENVLLRDASELAGYTSNEKKSVIVKRKDRPMNLDITTITLQEYYSRYSQWQEGKIYYELIDNGTVGYLYPGKFKNSDGPAIMEKFADTKAIIVDMRCYPEADLFNFLVNYFLPNDIHHVIWTKPAIVLPGYYVEVFQSWESKNTDCYQGIVVMLVNAETQSRAEYATMAFQALPGCVVVGSQTAGADGDVASITLPGDIRTLFSGVGVFYPDGTNTQRAGVRIDHYVTPTVEGIRAGRDEVLEKALEIINQK